MKFGIRGQLTDVITCVKFLLDRFRGYGVLTPPKLLFPIDLLRRPYNSVALQCDTVTDYAVIKKLLFSKNITSPKFEIFAGTLIFFFGANLYP